MQLARRYLKRMGSEDSSLNGDRDRLAQVLTDLVDHAFKFNLPGDRVRCESKVNRDRKADLW